MAVVIRVDGVDVTADVIYRTAEFTAQVNGEPGPFNFQVKDIGAAYRFLGGQEVTVDWNGERIYGGYVLNATNGFFFAVDEAPSNERLWTLTGSDYNFLLQRRVVYDKSDPTNDSVTALPGYVGEDYLGDPDPRFWAQNSPDTVIIPEILTNYSDIMADLAGSDIVGVGSPMPDRLIGQIGTGQVLASVLYYLARPPGAIFFIGPDKVFYWHDTRAITVPYILTDHPDGANDIGYRELTVWTKQTKMVNDAFVWGAGRGDAYVKFHRTQDQDSIDLHDRWQAGVYTAGLYTQQGVNEQADRYVYGSPSSKRAPKDDQVAWELTVFDAPIKAGDVLVAESVIFSRPGGQDLPFDQATDVLRQTAVPVRRATYRFPTKTDLRVDLIVNHAVDDPWPGYEYAYDPPAYEDVKIPPWDLPGEAVCVRPYLPAGWMVTRREDWESSTPVYRPFSTTFELKDLTFSAGGTGMATAQAWIGSYGNYINMGVQALDLRQIWTYDEDEHPLTVSNGMLGLGQTWYASIYLLSNLGSSNFPSMLGGPFSIVFGVDASEVADKTNLDVNFALYSTGSDPYFRLSYQGDGVWTFYNSNGNTSGYAQYTDHVTKYLGDRFWVRMYFDGTAYDLDYSTDPDSWIPYAGVATDAWLVQRIKCWPAGTPEGGWDIVWTPTVGEYVPYQGNYWTIMPMVTGMFLYADNPGVRFTGIVETRPGSLDFREADHNDAPAVIYSSTYYSHNGGWPPDYYLQGPWEYTFDESYPISYDGAYTFGVWFEGWSSPCGSGWLYSEACVAKSIAFPSLNLSLTEQEYESPFGVDTIYNIREMDLGAWLVSVRLKGFVRIVENSFRGWPVYDSPPDVFGFSWSMFRVNMERDENGHFADPGWPLPHGEQLAFGTSYGAVQDSDVTDNPREYDIPFDVDIAMNQTLGNFTPDTVGPGSGAGPEVLIAIEITNVGSLVPQVCPYGGLLFGGPGRSFTAAIVVEETTWNVTRYPPGDGSAVCFEGGPTTPKPDTVSKNCQSATYSGDAVTETVQLGTETGDIQYVSVSGYLDWVVKESYLFGSTRVYVDGLLRRPSLDYHETQVDGVWRGIVFHDPVPGTAEVIVCYRSTG